MQNLSENIFPNPVSEIVFMEEFPEMKDGELYLKVSSKNPPDYEKGYSPFYRFEMLNSSTGEVMGGLSFRVGYTHNDVHFRGNIGFSVNEQFRGLNYSTRSCRLIIPVIKFHDMKHVWITCNIDNFASIKSIEKLGAEYIETLAMPDDYPYIWYYPEAARVKRRYKWNIL